MSITLYSKYRRQGLRKAWSLAGMNSTAAYVSAGLIALLSAYVFVAWFESSMEDAERIGRSYGEAERKGLEQDARVLAHVLNGKPIRNTETGAMFFVEVSRQTGLDKGI